MSRAISWRSQFIEDRVRVRGKGYTAISASEGS